MQSQGNRLNVMSRKSQKKRDLKRISRVSPQTRFRNVPKGVRKYHIDPRSMKRIELPKPQPVRKIVRATLLGKKTCTLMLVEGASSGVNILTDDDRYRLSIFNAGLKMVKKFLQQNDPNVLERKSEISVFHMLVKSYQLDKVKLYIKHGMDVNYRNKKGKTALIKLVENINCSIYSRNSTEMIKVRDMIELLVDNGADPNIPDNEGNICLHYCLYSGTYLFRLLVHFGGNKFHMNNRGHLPICSSFCHSMINEARSLSDLAQDVIDFRKIDTNKLPVLLQSTPKGASNYKPVYDYSSLFPNSMSRGFCGYMLRRY